MAAFDNYFSHRCNGNSAYESICPGCFLIVGHARTQQELTLLEEGHVCQGMDALKAAIAARDATLRQIRLGLSSKSY